MVGRRILGGVATLALFVACSSESTADSSGADTTLAPTTASSAPSTESIPQSSTTEDPTTETADDGTSVVAFEAESDALTIEGDLFVPAGDGPFPAIVLVAGSGPQSRASRAAGQLGVGFGFEIDVFTELATGLADRGYIAAVYDKRTCVGSSGCSDNSYDADLLDSVLVDDFRTDAEAVVSMLRDRPEVASVSVLGHSQGGQLVPAMLADDSTLAAGVLLSAPFSAIDESLADQEELLRGLPGGEAAAAQVEPLVDQVAAIRAGDESDIPAGTTAEFWQSWFTVTDDLESIAADITQPVFVLGGEFDWNVPSEQVFEWERLLNEAGVETSSATLTCVTHALNCVRSPTLLDATASDIEPNIDPIVVDAIVKFLDQNLPPV